jgi:hypothetical protein
MLRHGVAARWRKLSSYKAPAARKCRRPLYRDGKDVGQTFECGIDFIARRRAPEAEPDSPHSHVRRDTHRLQNRRQLDAAGVAR